MKIINKLNVIRSVTVVSVFETDTLFFRGVGATELIIETGYTSTLI